ncbi:MAG TPA: hypothetical protein VLE99_00195 [Candidatus Saccharimonadales bacterium]|nr:hypothetical protein [Candidatus Saccharimonadales bacterium]
MTHDYYHVQEWTPQLKATGDELVARIHEVVPELEVSFIGAAALGLPGKNDIDLDILCNQSDLKRYADILTPVLGVPQAFKDNMVVWSYMDDDIEIDCILSDPTLPGSHVPKQKRTFEILKSSPELQERYKQLKYDCDGLPYEQYEAKKNAFWKEIGSL